MLSSRILQGVICLSWKTQLWHFCMKALSLWEAASRSALSAPSSSPDYSATLEHHPKRTTVPAANLPLCSREQSNSPKLQVTGNSPGLLQHRNSLERACDPRGLLTWEARIPPPLITVGSTKPDSNLSPLIHNMSQWFFTLPFIFVSFLWIWFQMLENSLLSASFPSRLSLPCLIVFHFQTRPLFSFQPLF